VSAIFLLIVGAFLNTWPLFYMSTVMLVTLVLLKLQAWLAVRGLMFERVAPQVVVAGERVTMRIRVWSTIEIKRPLLLIVDKLPFGLQRDEELLPLPVAPSHDMAVETRYEILPMKRGIYRWEEILVTSYDSLGLIRVDAEYKTEPFQITIHPTKIPTSVDLAALGGWGSNQSDDGKNRGYGMEPRGIREYTPGDSLRHVHWPSTAKTGKIQVKEFDTGFNTVLRVLVQMTRGTEAGTDEESTLEAMCGHLAHICDVFLQRGSSVYLSNLESTDLIPAKSASSRYRQLCDALATATTNRNGRFADEIGNLSQNAPGGDSVMILLTSAEEGVARAVRLLAQTRKVHVLLYDPDSYPTSKMVIDFLPCTDKDFVAALAAPNVRISIMPNPYAANRQIA
jgi:uncharacterized protein (DUF58 family)